VQYRDAYYDVAGGCKFDSIGQQVMYDLHQPRLITNDLGCYESVMLVLQECYEEVVHYLHQRRLVTHQLREGRRGLVSVEEEGSARGSERGRGEAKWGQESEERTQDRNQRKGHRTKVQGARCKMQGARCKVRQATSIGTSDY
jgi:hypothetical protein